MLEKLLNELAEQITEEFRDRETGHCLRVDNLSPDVCGRLCTQLRTSAHRFQTFVLAEEPRSDQELRPDQAVELRNGKNSSLCLLVPANLSQVTASSLGNSFSTFAFNRFLEKVERTLQSRLPAEIATLAGTVGRQLKGRAAVSREDMIDYLLSLQTSPSPEAAGRELWRVGLIPDPDESFPVRLQRNRACVDAIGRPARPQNSASERLSGLGLPEDHFKRRLANYLSGKVLSQTENWQRPISENPEAAEFAFGMWTFPEGRTSELNQIQIEPFLNPDGSVAAYCKLKTDEAGSLQAQVGPKQKVVVRWTSDPPTPSGVDKWKVELIPCRREYGDRSNVNLFCGFPKGTSRIVKSANVSLDLDEVNYSTVEIRVTALTGDGLEVTDAEGTPIESYSEEFWLTREVPPDDEKPQKKTEISLPLARLRFCVESKTSVAIVEETQPDTETVDKLQYFSVLLNRKTVARIAESPVISDIENYFNRNPRQCWPSARVEADQPINFEKNVLWDALPEDQMRTKHWTDFVRQRELLAKEFSAREPRNRVLAVQWDKDLSDRVRKYARAYRDLLEAVDSDGQIWALRVDTFYMEIHYPGGRRQTASLVLPWHPLRMLWYSGYCELLEAWRIKLASIESKSQRARAIDLPSIERFSPLNFPMFVPGQDDKIHIFSQNLGLFIGCALPEGTDEPARVLTEVSTSIGLPSEWSGRGDFPVEKLAKELIEYRRVHPYTETLRISVGNPGDGEQVGQALRTLLEDAGDVAPKLDIIANSTEPLPITLPGFDRLRDYQYASSSHRNASHLSPISQIAIRPRGEIATPPGGDINLALLLDESKPRISSEVSFAEQDSASVYGLLTRVVSDFRSTEETARWIHQVSFPANIPREKHPTLVTFTNDLVETQRIMMTVLQRWRGVQDGTLLSLTVELDHERRTELDRIHHSSDWVLLLDRFIGIDLFDDPNDPYLANTAKKYLLDYAPEFIEGLGHRLVVTTAWRQEVEQILELAMQELGFAAVKDSVGEVLQLLKSLSGRLALRMIHDNSRAKEAAGLGVVMAWMKVSGELKNSIILPVDSHPEIFPITDQRGVLSDSDAGGLLRCDLLQIRVKSNRLDVTFIEVKSRTSLGGFDALQDRMCDQMDATENRFRELFFSSDARIDHIVQRARLSAVLEFYAKRARRYGFFESDESYQEAVRLLSKLESGISLMRPVHKGFMVDIDGHQRKPFTHRGASFRVLTAADFAMTTLVISAKEPEQGETEGAPIAPKLMAPVIPPKSPPVPEHLAMPPTEAPTEIAVPIGSTVEDEVVSWRASTKGSPHLFILGIPGQGKSYTVTRLLCESARQGLPAVVIDFHGQFSAAESPYFQMVGPTVWDASKGLPFSPFEAAREQDGTANFWKTNCFALAEIFQYVFDMGDIQKGLIYDALKDCYLEAGIEDESPGMLPTLGALEKKIRQYEERRNVRNVLVRCKPVFEFNLFKETPAAVGGDILSASRRGLVVDLHRHSLEVVQAAAGAFVLRKIYKDMFRWGETSKLRLLIVLDEAHRISKDTTLPKIMKEGRKFGVVVVSASQGINDFHPDVLGNAGTKVVFRTNYPASRRVSGFVKLRRDRDSAEIIEQLSVGNALVQTPDMQFAKQVSMFAPEVGSLPAVTTALTETRDL
jgi:hypothetical protein